MSLQRIQNYLRSLAGHRCKVEGSHPAAHDESKPVPDDPAAPSDRWGRGFRAIADFKALGNSMKSVTLLGLLLGAQPVCADVIYESLTHSPRGNAVLTLQTDHLAVENLGSSGQDGVEITLPYTSGWDGHWERLDSDNSLPIGAYVQSQVFGNAGQISNGLLGSWRLTKQATGMYAVTADYSPLGSSTVTVQIYNGTNLVATRSEQSGQLGIMNGCVNDDHHGNPTPKGPFGGFGGALTMFGPVEITLGDNMTVMGDRFVILPEAATAVSSLTRVNVQTSGVPRLVITNESVDSSVGAYHNLALEYLRTNGLWMDGVTRYTSDNVNQTTTGIATFLKSAGFDPVATDAAVAAVLQNLSQANLLYTNGGVTYFGAPVTTDQFVPYLMASMQSSGAVSADFVAKVNSVNTMIIDHVDSAAVLAYVESSFLGTFATPADNHAAEVFVDTFKNSYTYWMDPAHQGGSGGQSSALKSGDGVIIADAVGALHGLILGPIVSIIEGAVVSIIANHSAMVVTSGNIGFGGLDHTGLGTATLDIQYNHLIVGNIGSSGQDGVEITLPYTSGWDGHWERLDSDNSLPIGAYVQSQVFGNAGQISNGLLGSWRLTKQATGMYAVTADYSPLGSSTVTVQIYNGTNLVATRSEQSGQLGIMNGCVDDDHHGNPTPKGPFGGFGGALTMFGPVEITLGDNMTVMGDRFVILPEAATAVSSLTRVNVQTSGVPRLVITNESVDSSVGAYHNLALEYLRTNGLWMDGVTRYTSDNVNQTTTGIATFLKSAGFDPVVTDAAVATVLQNLSQANLLYTNGGVTYFGAPVTTDQFVPYLMASMQSSGTVSADFVAKVNSVNTMIVNRVASATVLAYVESSFLGTFATPADNHAAEVFVDTFKNSYTYWMDPAHQGGSGGESLALKPGDGVIIADAVGGLYGLLLGPVGSIVYGATFSIIANHSAMVVTSGNIGFGGLDHTGLGTATLDIQYNHLIVGNIGSSGQDGVEIMLPYTSGWDGHWERLDSDNSLPIGAYVQSQVFGNAGQISNGLLGSWRLTKQATGMYAVTADYSPLGSSTVTVQIYNGTNLVATRSGQSGQLGIMNGCVDDDHHGNPTPKGPFGGFGGALTMFGPVEITLANNVTVTGDRFVILPEAATAVSSLTRVNVQTSGVPRLVITNESVDSSVGAYHNLALEYLRTHDLWMDGVTRYTSDNVNQTTTGIATFLKSAGFDPVATDAAVATVQQNLNQANLLYTNGGVTYFGAPVTTDQFVPYLMASMQSSGTVSADFVAKVNSVNTMIVNRVASATVLAYVESSFLGTFATPADNHAAEVFVDTFKNSYTYWMDPAHQGGSGGQSSALKSGDGVIIADAVGALHGLILGPIVSIIEGAVVSIIANHSAIAKTSGNVVFGDLDHTGLGAATLDIRYKHLVVGNIGSSGQDGVSMTMPKSASWKAHWQPLDPTGSMPSGAYLKSEISGTAGSIADGPLGSWRMTKLPSGSYGVTADFTPLGANTVTLQVFNGTALVTTLTGQSGAFVIVNGCVDDDHWGNPTPTGPYGIPTLFGGALTFNDPRTFSFVGGVIAQGDRLVILPEGGATVSSLSQTRLLANGVSEIEIDTEENFAQAPGYSDWVTTTTAAAGITPAQFGGPQADFDNDGFSNLLEYAFGTDATAHANAPMVTSGVATLMVDNTSNQYLTLACKHPTDRVTPVAQASENLQTWTPAVLVSSVLQTDGMLLDTWRTALPTTAKSQMMMRFHVTTND